MKCSLGDTPFEWDVNQVVYLYKHTDIGEGIDMDTEQVDDNWIPFSLPPSSFSNKWMNAFAKEEHEFKRCLPFHPLIAMESVSLYSIVLPPLFLLFIKCSIFCYFILYD